MIQVAMVLGIVCFLGYRILACAISVGDFVALLNASQDLGNSIQQIFMFVPQISQNGLHVNNIMEFMHYESVIEGKENGVSVPSGSHSLQLEQVNFQCFAASIANNILLRDVETAEDEALVWKALEMSGLAGKVRTFEHTIHTVLTKEFSREGVVLSGGELQKLALARLFAQDCDIMIPDEPSSALDPMAEYELNRQIMKAAEGRTLIMISHRLATTRDADRIIYMEKVIEETGTHEELMAKDGKYARLYRIQAEQYAI